MQFLKKHITELCLMLLLCGTLWGAVGISSATISVCGIVWHQLFCLQNCRSYLSGRGFHLSLLSPYSLERAFQNVRPTRFNFADRQHILLGVC